MKYFILVVLIFVLVSCGERPLLVSGQGLNGGANSPVENEEIKLKDVELSLEANANPFDMNGHWRLESYKKRGNDGEPGDESILIEQSDEVSESALRLEIEDQKVKSLNFGSRYSLPNRVLTKKIQVLYVTKFAMITTNFTDMPSAATLYFAAIASE